MKILKAFKYQLNLNRLQIAKMKNFAGSCRFVWNRTLAEQKEFLSAGQSCMNYSRMAAELVNWKQQEDTSFLKEVHSQILQQKLMDLDKM